MSDIKPIETRYAGCRFRSRLEARWAVLFDTLGIEWEYEPQGFHLSDGHTYLPDFRLPECDTWIEVKGAESALDKEMLLRAARELPRFGCVGERGPKLMVLGSIPEPLADEEKDYGWLALDEPDFWIERRGEKVDLGPMDWVGPVEAAHFGFGQFQKNRRPWWCNNVDDEYLTGDLPWLTPIVADEHGAPDAYRGARSARFEHGESPAGGTA
ncbi:hypothetical protein [Nocardia wallacei]|uniref:hypothetical protein n=1 Tax=Nocardia wallacei TaxID=480035 RepID=UPI002453A52F|nr:hypothetical protein [Nocardia wallacei]